MFQQPVLNVSLRNADMLVTGVDAFIIKCNELSERANSLRNCLSRVKGTEREASVQENIRRLDIYSRMTQFIPGQVRSQIGLLRDMVDNQAVGEYLSQTTGGNHFLAVLRDICYICDNDIIYTNLVKVKFTTFYSDLGLYAGNRRLGYDCLNLIEELKASIYQFLKQLEQYEAEVQARLYSYDRSFMADDLDIVLNPSIEVLGGRVNEIAAHVDGCVQDYYDGGAALGETQIRLRSLAAQLVRLKSIIPLGFRGSNEMLNIIEARLRLCNILFNSVTAVDGARNQISSIYSNQIIASEEPNTVSAISFNEVFREHSIETYNSEGIDEKEGLAEEQTPGQEWVLPLVEFKPQ